jgi:hypothetical protein
MDFQSIATGFIVIFISIVFVQNGNLKDELKEIKEHTAYIKRVADANATKQRVFNDMNTEIEKDYNATVNELDNSDVIDFGN